MHQADKHGTILAAKLNTKEVINPMKFISKSGSRIKKPSTENAPMVDKTIEYEDTHNQAGKHLQQNATNPADYFSENTLPTEEEHTSSQPQVTDKLIYPESSLSARQLEAINSVIRPSEHVPGQIGFESLDESLQPSVPPVEVPGGAGRVVKIVFLVLFIVAAVSAAAYGGWYWWWTTHATFDYAVQPVVILEGQDVNPIDFMDNNYDSNEITVEFYNYNIDLNVGMQFVPLKLTFGMRTLETSAPLYILTPVEYVVHELAEEGTIRPIDFIANPEVASRAQFDIYFLEEPLPLQEYSTGDFVLHLALNSVPFEAVLRVVDTTPPTAITEDLSITVGQEVMAEDFIVEVFDASPIYSISFVEPPDMYYPNPQIVQIAIEDIYGNVGFTSAQLTITFNQIPPVISGVPEIIESQIGATINFYYGVTAYDDFGRALEVHVDSVNVDINTVGVYIAILWAEDSSGLRTEYEVEVHIHDFNPENLHQEVDEILSEILNDDMSQADQVLAIHNWVRQNLSRATTDAETQSVLAGAYSALQNRQGDSFIYSAISSLMLTRAGVPNMLVERTSDAETAHRWVFVNPDDLGWHHFDPFPTGLTLGDQTSMFTSTQAQDFAQRIYGNGGAAYYFTFDENLFLGISIVAGESE